MALRPEPDDYPILMMFNLKQVCLRNHNKEEKLFITIRNMTFLLTIK